MVKLGPQQRGAVVQHAAERMPDTPHRFAQTFELLEQLVEQVVPVIVHRETRIMSVPIHVRDPVFRRKGLEQLAIGRRGEAVGMSEKDRLRHELKVPDRLSPHCLAALGRRQSP